MVLALTTGALVQETLDQVMLSQDKLFVVLAVVLIIWAGFVAYVFALDRKLTRLESAIAKSGQGGTDNS